jgi:PKD repeat protein
MTRRLPAGVFTVVLLFAISCNDITYPVSPTITPPASGTVATNILLTATPDRLPPTGGASTIAIKVISRNAGGVESGVSGVKVKVESTDGSLDASEVTTNDAGEGSVHWTTTSTGTVIARAGSLNANVTIAVETAIPRTVPPTLPPPVPGPSPSPPTPPGPLPDVPVALTATPAPATIGQPVTLTAVATVPAGSGVVRGYEWTFGDGATAETLGGVASTTHVYATPGTYSARVVVRMTTWANGIGTAAVTVNDIAPAVTVTLAAVPESALPGENITLTATATPNRTAGAVSAYDWDFDTTTASVDRTTTVNTTTFNYATLGNRTIRVTAKTANGTSASATETVSITAPALNVALSAAPPTQTVGAAIAFTATVTSSAVLPGTLTFEWDYDNNGSVDETTTGATPGQVTHVYNTAGAKTPRVTVKASDGRTATNTTQVTVN